MTDLKLTISSKNRNSFETRLLSSNPDIFKEEDITNLLDTEKDHGLYSSESYSFAVSPIPQSVSSGIIYLNGTQPRIDEFSNYSAYQYDSEKGCFILRYEDEKYAAFNDTWGYVQIHIRLEYEDGHFEDYYTRYLEVNNDSTNMQGMASLVYRGFPELLAKNGILKSKVRADLNQMAEGPLDLKIGLIRKTARVYNQHYNFFMTNARFTTKQIETVDKLEKLNYVTTGSLQYVVQHPEELYPVHTFNGIRVGRQVYHPRHIKMTKSVISYDTYENHVIIDFLDQMLKQLDGIEKTLTGLLDEQRGNFLLLFEHLFSRDYITNKIPEVQNLKQYLNKLLRRYTAALNLKPSLIKKTPLATHVFREVPQYREIFECVREWYKGVYDFEQSRFLLYCIGSSRLYESYVLTAVLEYLQTEGYTIEASKFEYDVLDDKYQNTTFNNTFRCEKDDSVITVYYQPVVYSDRRMLNGLELMKTHSNDKSTGYYTPDYIFKIERKPKGIVIKNAQYVICDAKFSNLETVKALSFRKVIDKYEGGIAPLGGAYIANHAVVYGKYNTRDPLIVIFGETDIYASREDHSSVASIIPVAYEFFEANPEAFYANIDGLFHPNK